MYYIYLAATIKNSRLTPISKNKYFEPIGIINRTSEFTNAYTWVKLGDKECIDGYTWIGNSIFGGEIACNISPLINIDISSFEVYAGTQYAKDKNHVYYPIVIPCIDFEDCGVCFFSEYIIKGANPETFRYLDKDYAKDNKFVYFRGKKIENADSKSFKVIEGPDSFYFAKDKNNVYKHSSTFKDADALSFMYDANDYRNKPDPIKIYIIKDKNNVWKYSPPDLIKKIE